jgi:hypothetical protein
MSQRLGDHEATRFFIGDIRNRVIGNRGSAFAFFAAAATRSCCRILERPEDRGEQTWIVAAAGEGHRRLEGNRAAFKRDPAANSS